VDAQDEKRPARLALADRLALRPKEAAAALGLSERAFRALLPSLPHVRAGGAVLIPVEALRQWLAAQAKAQANRVDEAVSTIMDSFRKQVKDSKSGRPR